MEYLGFLVALGSLLVALVSLFGNRRSQAITAAKKNTEDITRLQEQVSALRERMTTLNNTIEDTGVKNISVLNEKVINLGERLEKLDRDVEGKIDKLTDKFEELSKSINEFMLSVAKQLKDV